MSHTRAETERGTVYCDECSRAAGAWVLWPCAESDNPDGES